MNKWGWILVIVQIAAMALGCWLGSVLLKKLIAKLETAEGG